MLYTKIFHKDSPYECIIYYKDKECTIIHRENGPAIEWYDGVSNYYLNGVKFYSEKEYLQQLAIMRFGNFY